MAVNKEPATRIAVLKHVALKSSSFSSEKKGRGKGEIKIITEASFLFPDDGKKTVKSFDVLVSLVGEAYKIDAETNEKSPAFEVKLEYVGSFDVLKPRITNKSIMNDGLRYIDQIYPVVISNFAELTKQAGIQSVTLKWSVPEEIISSVI